jgi:hypothetical protein
VVVTPAGEAQRERYSKHEDRRDAARPQHEATPVRCWSHSTRDNTRSCRRQRTVSRLAILPMSGHPRSKCGMLRAVKPPDWWRGEIRGDAPRASRA